MKAIILAAGYATRLYPLTKNKPKPLLEVRGKPIIEHILKRIGECGIEDVYVVTNDKFFTNFLEWKANYETKLNITVVNDRTKSNDDRLGSLGDTKYTIEVMDIDDDVLIVAGDNLFEFSLKDVFEIYKEKKTAVVALYDVKDFELAKLYGIVSVDENSKVIHFEEKPEKPKSTLSSTGVYFYSRETIKKLFEFISQEGKKDKAGDFLEWLYKKENVYEYP